MCVYPKTLMPFFDQEKETISYKFQNLDFAFLDKDKNLFIDENGEAFEPLPAPCGKCMECISSHKNIWIHRLLDEASLYQDNSFITLTYAEAPADGVSKREVQLFLKRLRKEIYPVEIRFFACGEYGSKGKRPHYHLIIFNYSFPDRVLFKRDKKGNNIFRSPLLEKVWRYGFSSVAPVTDATLAYVTKDMQKLLPLNDTRARPFTLMSLKPGIGLKAAKLDIENDKIYHNGKYIHIPRYYRTRLLTNEQNLYILKMRQNFNVSGAEMLQDVLERRKIDKERKQKIESHKI